MNGWNMRRWIIHKLRSYLRFKSRHWRLTSVLQAPTARRESVFVQINTHVTRNWKFNKKKSKMTNGSYIFTSIHSDHFKTLIQKYSFRNLASLPYRPFNEKLRHVGDRSPGVFCRFCITNCTATFWLRILSWSQQRSKAINKRSKWASAVNKSYRLLMPRQHKQQHRDSKSKRGIMRHDFVGLWRRYY